MKIKNPFKGMRYPADIILQMARWYLAYALSTRNLEEMLAERGVNADHSTLSRWAIKFSPRIDKVFRRRYKRQPGTSWRVDETHVKVKGQWKYQCRAVDSQGQAIDFGFVQ